MGLVNKNTIAAVVILLVILAIFAVPRFLGSDKSGISYKTAQVDRNDVISLITATGTINPLTTIDIGTPVSGTVSSIYVDFNSEVKKGDPLAEIDPAPLKTELKRTEADNKKAQADFKIANSLYMTNKELYEKRLIPKEEFDDSQAKYSSALAANEQSEVALEIAQSNLNNTIIRSPIDGIILTRNVNAGQAVIPNNKPLFVVAENLATMKLDANVGEVHIGKVKEGQKVNFTVDAYLHQIFHGTVSQVRNDPIITNNIVTYNVVVLFENDNLLLKPGMTAEVEIIIADKKDVLRVPTAALRFIPPPSTSIKAKPDENSGDSYVWILLENGQLAAVPVKPGESDSTYTEIIDGDLKEGQEVIVESSSENKSDSSSSYLPQPGRF